MRAFTNYDTDWHKAKFLSSVEEGPVVKISVPTTDMISRGELERGKKDEQPSSSSEPAPPREFLVGKPVFMSNSPTGSGTKGFIAYDVAEDRLVFLKDCWRPEAETYHPEGEVYLHLHSHHVHYIATPVGAGDVVDDCGGIHTTRAEKYVGGPRWRHYRLILEEVAMPLEEYTTSYEFVDVMYCAVQAHEEAWQAEVLHRDVSAFNIMIRRYRDPKDGIWKCDGLLVDWGLCKFARDFKRPAVRKNRSGTWQFISAVLLVFPGKFAHAVWHDLESFVHVFYWCCLRFHKTNFSDDGLQDWIHIVYDTHKTKNGISFGGRAKLLMLRRGYPPFDLLGGSLDPALPREDSTKPGYGLTELLSSLASLCKEHYKSLEAEIPELATTSSTQPAPAAEPAKIPPRRSGLGMRKRTTQDVKLEEPARPVLSDHSEILALLDNALCTSPNAWIDHPKVPDQFAQFKHSPAAQRASASTQSLKRVSLNDDVDENPAKRLKMDGGSSYATVSASDDLISIPEDMPTQAE